MTHTTLQPSYTRAHRAKTHTDASIDDSAPRLLDQSEATVHPVNNSTAAGEPVSVKSLTDRID